MTSARPLIVRLLGGSGAVIVFLIALIASLGAALGAPLGLFLVRRRARRRNRHTSRIASFVGAVASATVVGVVIWGVFGSLMPRPTPEELNGSTKLPAWYTKAFPQAARTDSASEQLMRSPGFLRAALVMGSVIIGLILGVIGGSLGWCADILLGFARSFDGNSERPVSLGPG